jgi:hypothetical protein
LKEKEDKLQSKEHSLDAREREFEQTWYVFFGMCKGAPAQKRYGTFLIVIVGGLPVFVQCARLLVRMEPLVIGVLLEKQENKLGAKAKIRHQNSFYVTNTDDQWEYVKERLQHNVMERMKKIGSLAAGRAYEPIGPRRFNL